MNWIPLDLMVIKHKHCAQSPLNYHYSWILPAASLVVSRQYASWNLDLICTLILAWSYSTGPKSCAITTPIKRQRDVLSRIYLGDVGWISSDIGSTRSKWNSSLVSQALSTLAVRFTYILCRTMKKKPPIRGSLTERFFIINWDVLIEWNCLWDLLQFGDVTWRWETNRPETLTYFHHERPPTAFKLIFTQPLCFIIFHRKIRHLKLRVS